ncbi:MAG: nitroreductase family protein [Flavobacteriales bacterium]|jgi:nitroreductase|nr:nitroreductase family protein [Flavobacteriales bacterium]
MKEQEDYIIEGGFRHNRFTPRSFSKEEMLTKSQEFYEEMKQRKSIRFFSDEAVDIQIIENLIKTAGTAPSGANKQPWKFCVVSNPELKKEIRIAAEKEEKLSYESRMSDRWLKDLAPLGTDWQKPFLEIAPYLIIVFKENYGLDEAGNKTQNYYVNESVGLAAGFLISAIHQAGLVTLTHTPSPMKFLAKILKRPKNESPFLLLPVGFAAEKTFVPSISKKPIEEIMISYE